MRNSQHRCRQFPPQVSKEELLQRTRQTLTEKGVDYVSQSKYVVKIAEEVVGFDEPIFSSIQPEIKIRDSNAWNQAYSIIMTFLQENGMEQTINAIDIELQGQQIPDGDPNTKAEDFLKPLLKISNQLKRKTFSARVAEFTGKYSQRRAAKKSGATQNIQNEQTYQPPQTQKRPTSKAPAQTKPEPSRTQPVSNKPAPEPVRTSQPQPTPTRREAPQQQQQRKVEEQPARQSFLNQNSKPQPATQKREDTTNNRLATQPQPAPAKRNPSPPMSPKIADQKKKSPWDAVPMAEPPTQHANSMMDDLEEEEEEEDIPIVPKQLPVIKRNQPPQKKSTFDSVSFSDGSDSGAPPSPPSKNTKPQAAKSGWDAPAFEEVEDVVSDVVDGEEIDIDDGNNQEEEDLEFGEEDFDFEI